jgi:uncharacterized protein (TIGR02001 family)
MKNLTKMVLGAASLAGLLSVSAPAVAQDAPSWALNGTVAVQSDYRFRGISQSDRGFAPQGSLTLTGPDGWYVSAWGSKVDFDPTNSTNPDMELDIYGGKHTDLWGVDWTFMRSILSGGYGDRGLFRTDQPVQQDHRLRPVGHRHLCLVAGTDLWRRYRPLSGFAALLSDQ